MTYSTIHRSACWLILIASRLTIAVVSAQPIARQAISHHQSIVNGQLIHYTATVQETWLTDTTGKLGVSIMTTAYTRDTGINTAQRPVVVVFNGGPGASSMPLHMTALGPKRIRRDIKTDSTRLVDNPNTLLDRADLIFVDPAGTGFTRVQDSTIARSFWSVKPDAKAVVDILKIWLKTHHRESSPLYLCGESYGTVRAVQMLTQLGGVPVSGIILLSAMLDLGAISADGGHDLPYLLYLPTMAAVAWYHHKADRRFTSVEQIYTQATRFAQTDYAVALMQGSHISGASQKRVSAVLSQLIGLPAETILSHKLRISPSDFQHLLLARQGLRTGQLNGQVTGPLRDDPTVHPAYQDPSMFRSTGNRRVTKQYFNQTLDFLDTRPYQTVNLGVNAEGKWQLAPSLNPYWTVAPLLEDAMQQRPGLRLLVAGGYYDLATPLYATRYTIDHVGIPSGQLTFAPFPTGHSIFDDEIQFVRFTQQLRAFITAH